MFLDTIECAYGSSNDSVLQLQDLEKLVGTFVRFVYVLGVFDSYSNRSYIGRDNIG